MPPTLDIAKLLQLAFGTFALMSAGVAALPYEQAVQPLLQKYCADCHGGKKPKGDLDLSKFASEAQVLDARETWKKIHDALYQSEMPPKDEEQPSSSDRLQLTDWIMAMLERPEPDGARNPGHVALRRLNQVEYNNTVHDLFGVYRAAPYFDPQKGMPETVRLVPHHEQRKTLVTLPPDDLAFGYDNIGEVLSLPPFLMEKYLSAARQVVEKAGSGSERVKGMPNRQQPQSGDEQTRARYFLSDFLYRAFRRPPEVAEIDRFFGLFQLASSKGEPFDKAILIPIQAALVSPHFLFRVENGVAAEEKNGVRPLNDFELASRLSYFLWSTMPDGELLRVAADGKLRDPAVLEQQARRMLRHRFSKELAERFGLQWLQIDSLRSAMPDADRFPEFYKLKYLSTAMRTEAMLFFETILVEDRSVLEFIDSDWTWANGIMADYYGIVPGKAQERNSSLFWVRYPLTDKRRGGVLTMAGPLTASSIATRTSPVKRGKWVLEVLFNTPPPPPSPSVPDLDNTPVAADTASIRERLEIHRSDPACASCHARLDPMGFGLENFDAIGRWRDSDGPKPIAASGTLPNGSTFNGVVELKRLLLTKRREDFVRGLTQHLMTYALGRKIEYSDASAVREICDALKRDNYRFSTLVTGIVTSYPFRYLKTTPSND